MKISVLMCNYNYGEFIGQAIDSVLQQTFADFEVIIVDDGSTDCSRDVIETYDDPRIVKVFQENGGQASAFNAGFELSTGEVVCFLDSDDWWAENKLEAISNWHNLLKGDYAIIQHQMRVWDNGETSHYKSILSIGDCFAELCRTGNIDYFVPTSGISIPRGVCKKVFPIPETLRICADAFLTRASIAFGDVISMPQAHGYYRKHQNTVYLNKTFDANHFFQKQLFPLLKAFYTNNDIKVPPVMMGERTQEPRPKLTFRQKLFRLVAGDKSI